MKKLLSFLFLFIFVFVTSCEKEEFAVSDLCKGYWLTYDEIACPFCGEGVVGVRGFVWKFHENREAICWDFTYAYGFIGSTYETTSYRYSTSPSTVTITLPSGNTDENTGTWKVSLNPDEENSYVWTKDDVTLHLHYSEINPVSREVQQYIAPGTTFSVDNDFRCRADAWTPISEDDFKSFVEGSIWAHVSTTGIDNNGNLSEINNYWRGWEKATGEDTPPVYTFSNGYLTVESRNLLNKTTFYKKYGKYTYKADDGNSVWIAGEKQPHLQILKMDHTHFVSDRLCFIEYLGWSPRHQRYRYAYSIYEKVDKNPWQ